MDQVSVVHVLPWLEPGLQSKQRVTHSPRAAKRKGRERRRQEGGPSLTPHLFSPSGKAEGSCWPATLSLQLPALLSSAHCQPLSPLRPTGLLPSQLAAQATLEVVKPGRLAS